MKHTKTLSLLLLIILYSCGQKGTDDLQQTFSYQLDTVLINSKGKNLDLTRNITNSDLNVEESTIYLFNSFDHSIDEINLEKLEYVRSIPFEKEGPNGTSHINYIYALADDLFFIKGSVKSGVFDKKGIVSVDILQNTYQGFLEQVKFSPPVWDKVNKRYLRLSAQRVYTDIKSENSFLHQIKETKVFLTVFDEDFNLISEGEVPEFNSESVKYFAKDGKLWYFTNVDDELGFVILSLEN